MALIAAYNSHLHLAEREDLSDTMEVGAQNNNNKNNNNNLIIIQTTITKTTLN